MRRRLSTLLRLAVAVGLTLLILWRADPAAVGRALTGLDWTYVALAVALVAADRALMAYRWIALLAPIAPDRRPPLAALLRIFFISTFVGTFLPASIGSDAVRAWSLARDGVAGSASVASVLLDRLLGVISIVLAAAAGLALAPEIRNEPLVLFTLAGFALASGAALALVFSTRLDDRLRSAIARWRESRPRTTAERLLAALRAYAAHHRVLGVVLAASVGVQALRIVQAWLLGAGLGLETGLTSYAAFIPIILLVMLLPVTVNGLGTSNLAFVWAFDRVGVGAADAFALSVLFVALGVVGNLPGGALYAIGRRADRPA